MLAFIRRKATIQGDFVCIIIDKYKIFYVYVNLVRSLYPFIWGLPGGSEVKVSAWNSGDPGSIPGSGRSPGEGNGNPLHYSCLKNPMVGGAW